MLHEMLLNKAKGCHIFLGNYTLFDSDKLLDMLVDILSRKLNLRPFRPEDILEDVDILDEWTLKPILK